MVFIVHSYKDKEGLCDRPGVIKMNEDNSKMVFNINYHCFHPSKTFILGAHPVITNADI